MTQEYSFYRYKSSQPFKCHYYVMINLIDSIVSFLEHLNLWNSYFLQKSGNHFITLEIKWKMVMLSPRIEPRVLISLRRQIQTIVYESVLGLWGILSTKEVRACRHHFYYRFEWKKKQIFSLFPSIFWKTYRVNVSDSKLIYKNPVIIFSKIFYFCFELFNNVKDSSFF